MSQHNDLFRMVHETYVHFGQDGRHGPTHLDIAEENFRLVGMREELDEYEDAGSLDEKLDALVDLVIWALGTAERHGFHLFNEAFRRVDAANRTKVLGRTSRSGGTHETDLIKPPGFEPPDLQDLVDERIEGHPHPFSDEPALTWVPMLKRASDLSMRKSLDYGDPDHSKSTYHPFGALSYLQMLHTKFERLKSVTIGNGSKNAEGSGLNFESAVDSALDLINYTAFFAHWLEDRDNAQFVLERHRKGSPPREFDDFATEDLIAEIYRRQG